MSKGCRILGFTPFFTGFVFFRNGWRALHERVERTSGARVFAALLFGAVMVVGVPLVAQFKISQFARESVAELIVGNPQQAERATQRLRLIGYLTNVSADEIVWAYNREQDAARKERLARSYMAVTGKDIERRLQILLD